MYPRTRIPGHAKRDDFYKQYDVYELVAEYVQSKVEKYYKEAEASEKHAKVKFMKDW